MAETMPSISDNFIIRGLSSILPLILHQFRDCLIDVLGLGEDDVFQRWLVGDEGVHCGHALYRGIEVFEELVGDAGGYFSSVAPAEHVFVGDDDAAGLLD